MFKNKKQRQGEDRQRWHDKMLKQDNAYRELEEERRRREEEHARKTPGEVEENVETEIEKKRTVIRNLFPMFSLTNAFQPSPQMGWVENQQRVLDSQPSLKTSCDILNALDNLPMKDVEKLIEHITKDKSFIEREQERERKREGEH